MATVVTSTLVAYVRVGGRPGCYRLPGAGRGLAMATVVTSTLVAYVRVGGRPG